MFCAAKKIFLPLLLAGAFSASAWQEPQKKIISCGWMIPRNIQYYQVPVEKIEGDLPFDGFEFSVELDLMRNGKKVRYWNARNTSDSPILLEKEDFKEWIDTFSKLKFKRFKHNFLAVNSSQFSCDWFDDAAWKKTLHNHKMLVWLAKQLGCKGIAFDAEGYSFTGQPFAFRPELGKSAAETEKKVRERGAEWIKAIASEYPDMTLFCFIWSGDIFGTFYDRQEPDTINETLYLLRAFINGVYDALPQGIKILDGNEDPGYHSASEADFNKVVADFRYYPRRIIAPENLAKYYTSTKLAYSLYLDSYMPGNRAPYNIWTKHPNPVRLLQENVARSLARSDEYMWIWAEHGTFFQNFYPRNTYKPWDVRLPHTTDAIRAARDPIGTAKKYAGPNLLKNSSMQPDSSGQNVYNWFKWQREKQSKGVLKGENGGALLQGVVNGSFNQDYKTVKVGERYLLTGKVKVTGSTVVPCLAINYYDGKGTGHWRIGRKAVFGPPDKDGWRHGAVLADIPDGHDVKFIRVGLSSSAPRTGEKPDGSCLFDDVELRLVQYPWDK